MVTQYAVVTEDGEGMAMSWGTHTGTCRGGEKHKARNRDAEEGRASSE